MERKYYTNERNVQIVIGLLKAHGIRKVVVSPGTTNITFVGSIQQDSYFELYSSVDERSAAYIACGLAAQSGEPVVLSCTGATASRNYFSGLTEAFYRKLPILAITSHQGHDRLGHLIAQNIDRRRQPNDVVNLSVEVPMIHTARDEFYCTIEANKAILELKRNGGGPVHVNLFTNYSKDFSVSVLPAVRVIKRYTLEDNLPELPMGTKAIFVGAHKLFTEEQNVAIESFCSSNNAVVICDHSSGYYGRYRVQPALTFSQTKCHATGIDLDLLIHIGEVSGDYSCYNIKPKEVWRVNEDGELRDMFRTLSNVFSMSEKAFFEKYAIDKIQDATLLNTMNSEYDVVYNAIPELPFSNIWVAKVTAPLIPQNSILHLGILNSLRSWDFFKIHSSIQTSCNVGGFGIDGGVSSLVGASLVEPQKLCFGIFGDLAFFYDMNVIGNRHIGRNLRIILVNNGCGAEFRLYSHPCYTFGTEANAYMAAAGHFGNKSSKLVKHYAEDLGFKYMSASNKEEYYSVIEEFTSLEMGEQPILLEVFTKSDDESMALLKIKESLVDEKLVQARKVVSLAKKVVGEAGINIIRKALGK